MHGRTDVRKFTPVSYKTSALWGYCPKSMIVAKMLDGQHGQMPLGVCMWQYNGEKGSAMKGLVTYSQAYGNS